jgi:hypothetical protein
MSFPAKRRVRIFKSSLSLAKGCVLTFDKYVTILCDLDIDHCHMRQSVYRHIFVKKIDIDNLMRFQSSVSY